MAFISSSILGVCGIALVGASYLHAERLQPGGASAAQRATTPPLLTSTLTPVPETATYRGLINRYCVTCHNERLRTAGLMLDKANIDQVGEDAEIWEKVVRKLHAKAMPPAGRARPDPSTYESLTSWLEAALDRAAAARPNPGRRPAFHRLNRLEYTNAIRDLLGLEIDGPSLLPADESAYGFDNIANVLSLTPALIERYMLAARKISRLAIGDLTIRPSVATYRLSPSLSQQHRMTDDLPFGSRGGTAVRHHFPLDGEYVVKIRLGANYASPAKRGLERREQLDIRLDGTRIRLFHVGGECVGSSAPRCQRVGTAILGTSEYERTADQDLEARFSAKAGTRLVGVSFMQRTEATEGAAPAHSPLRHSSFLQSLEGAMSVDSVLIEGPFNPSHPGDTPSRRRIFVCHPASGHDEEPCAKRVLATIARRAYRRPVTDRDVEMLLTSYRAGRSDKGDGRSNKGFEAGIQAALESLLVSPHFLLRVERDPEHVVRGAAYRISDLELASRLSFFLWSSVPDDQLFDLAVRGELRRPTVLEQQVRRMLADERATALVQSFGGQWLALRNLRSVAPDPRVFPDFDDNLRDAFQRETELLLDSQIREDRSLVELLTANYTFVNEALARFYGIPNVYGSHFRRVPLTDPKRIGLLGHGSILTVTSYSTRTSPVARGKWLLDNILGAPPPPPPPNVPSLKEDGENGFVPVSMRERMEQHRANPVCATCHIGMDPLGFALENFDGIGRWRNTDGDTPIDASGAFPDGTSFDGPAAFRHTLLNRREEFVRTVTEKLLTYALGRGPEYYDNPAIREIMRSAAPDYRWSSLILGIVKSVPFQMRASSAADGSRAN
jgi:hypothetical protein